MQGYYFWASGLESWINFPYSAFIFYFCIMPNSPWFGSRVAQLKWIVSWKWVKLYLQDCPKEISTSCSDIHAPMAQLSAVQLSDANSSWGSVLPTVPSPPDCKGTAQSHLRRNSYLIWAVVTHVMPECVNKTVKKLNLSIFKCSQLILKRPPGKKKSSLWCKPLGGLFATSVLSGINRNLIKSLSSRSSRCKGRKWNSG